MLHFLSDQSSSAASNHQRASLTQQSAKPTSITGGPWNGKMNGNGLFEGRGFSLLFGAITEMFTQYFKICSNDVLYKIYILLT